MADVSQTTSIPVLITALTAANTLLVAVVAFFLARFFSRFDDVAKEVIQHGKSLADSNSFCNERTKRVDAALLELQNDQDEQDDTLGEHTRILAEHGVKIANIEKYIPNPPYSK